MAQLKDVLEIEWKRIPQGPHNIIYLFPEGTFYRAYEWSAWLCCRYMNQFKATRREQKTELKDDTTAVFIGFPITSLAKYLPEDAQVVSNDDKSVAITLPPGMFSVTEGDETVVEDFRQWKDAVPMAQSRRTSLRDELKGGAEEHPHRMSEVMLRVLSFPVEQKTPMECMAFIAEVKQQLASLLELT
jgi:hypothetical protein